LAEGFWKGLKLFENWNSKMQKKILIVDDHDDLSTVLTGEFSELGHLIKVAESRDEAVTFLEDENFDLIITDLDGEHLTDNGGDFGKNNHFRAVLFGFFDCPQNFGDIAFNIAVRCVDLSDCYFHLSFIIQQLSIFF
jgi:hypothetical protein